MDVGSFEKYVTAIVSEILNLKSEIMSASTHRQETLERLKSPDDLDRMMVVVSGKTWLAFTGLVVFCAAVIVWSFVAKIPVTVEGFGILIAPGNVRAVHSTGEMQLEWKVGEGQHVKKDEVIAVSMIPDDSYVKRAELRRTTMIAHHKRHEELDAKRETKELDSIRKKRAFIAEQMAKEKELNKELVVKEGEFTTEQRENLAKSKAMAMKLNESLKSRVETIKRLLKEGLSSGEAVLNVETSFMDSETKLIDIQVQIKQLEMQDLEGKRKDNEFSSRMTDLELQRLELDLQETKLIQELLANRITRESELRDADEKLEDVKFEFELKSQVTSLFDGRILSLSVPTGAEVKSGARIAVIAIDSNNDELKNLTYFSVKDGKRLTVGSPVYITPATVERERYGSIMGTVSRISSFPITHEAASNMIGNSQIADALLQKSGAIEVEMTLDKEGNSFSGYRWTGKGPDLKFSAGTTTIVRATVEDRRPITFVLPFLRTWLFGEKDDAQPKL